MDESYMLWIEEIKSRYKKTQVKAAVKVNAEQLLFNWQLGRDLVIRKAEERWGAGVVEQVSLDMKAAFPNSKGFSTTNLWNMKKWYLFYSRKDHAEKLHQLGGEIQGGEKQKVTKLHQLGGESDDVRDAVTEGVAFPLAFSFVPWRHHVDIITQCKNIDEALFYIRKTIEEGWSRQHSTTVFMPSCIKVKVAPSVTLRIICSRNRAVWHRKSPRIPMTLDSLPFPKTMKNRSWKMNWRGISHASSWNWAIASLFLEGRKKSLLPAGHAG